MYAKDIREVNKEKTVSGNYIVFLDATVKSWIEGLFKATVYQAGLVAHICNSRTLEAEAGQFATNLKPASAT